MPDSRANIPPYSAADLLLYATGRMTAPQMHELEKAALEDPFLAEALEGMKASITVQEEAALQKAIDRLPPLAAQEERKVIPLWRRKAIQWAAAAAVLLGLGWFSFGLWSNNNGEPEKDIVRVTTPDSGAPIFTDSVTAVTPLNWDSSAIAMNSVPKQDNGSLRDSYVFLEQEANEAPAPTVNEEVQMASPRVLKADTARSDIALGNHEVAKDEAVTAEPYMAKGTKEGKGADTLMNQSFTAFNKRTNVPADLAGRAAGVAITPLPYRFKGKITDAKNNPVPYASVMVEGQNFGTYTDAKGYFNFISVDSTLPVRTRSVGYSNQYLTLKSGEDENKIVMQEDKPLQESIATQVQTPSSKTPRRTTLIETDSIEGTAKPRIGFSDYNLYLANNIRLNYIPLTGRQVQLLFDIDKDGKPTNITVVKSSGQELDNEAIRLLKEGPKWKTKKDKKGKVTLKF